MLVALFDSELLCSPPSNRAAKRLACVGFVWQADMGDEYDIIITTAAAATATATGTATPTATATATATATTTTPPTTTTTRSINSTRGFHDRHRLGHRPHPLRKLQLQVESHTKIAIQAARPESWRGQTHR